MTRSFSIYLDLLRFLAACLVVVYHSNLRSIVTSVLPLSSYGHSAVILFFVLSGYVIAYATDTKEHSARDYWASRLSRVWSLALPAILLTPLLDVIGQSLAPALYAGNTTEGLAVLRVFTSLAFLNEIWFISIMSFSNIAYWSLNYEVWYYLLFALYTFSTGRRRWLWLSLAALIVGPKVLLLAPIWVLGVVIYRCEWLKQISEWQGWFCVTASIVLFAAFEHYQAADLFTEWFKSIIGPYWHRQMTFSRWFLSDYLLAAIVFLHFVGMRRVIFRIEKPVHALEKPVRFLAGFTFSIYILHQPLIYFYAALIDLPPNGYLRYSAVMTCVAASVFAIGSATEKRRFALRLWLLAQADRQFMLPKEAS